MKRIREGIKPVNVMKALGMTVLAFMISLVLVSPLSFSAMSLFTPPEKTDFTISDFYQQVANNRPVRTLDPDVVIADIAALDREGIASLIDVISESSPRAVGVDVTFLAPGDPESDSHLIEALRSVPNLVLACTVDDTSSGRESASFARSETTFFIDSIDGVAEGVVNFPAKEHRGTVREFAPLFVMKENGDTILSFAAALASRVDPGSLRTLLKRGNDHEIIDYPSREFTIISPEEIYDRRGELAGKTVIVGAAGELGDIHSTPVTSRMPGIEMHAFALSQILGGRYYAKTGRAADWIMAFLLCYAVILLSISIKPTIKGFVTRILQLVIVYASVQIGYLLFVDHRIVTNFSYILLMLTFGLFAVDLWNGAVVMLKNRHIKKIIPTTLYQKPQSEYQKPQSDI